VESTPIRSADQGEGGERHTGRFEVREVLGLWLAGHGFRVVERLSGVDRKTVRRYVAAAEGLGLGRDGGQAQSTEVLLGSVVEAVRPQRRERRATSTASDYGSMWRAPGDRLATEW
jgi:hypothetical protein